METLIKKYKESSLLMRILLVLPIAVLVMFYGLPAIFDNETKKRKKVDNKDKQLAKDIAKAEKESSSREGEISRLEKEKAEQLGNLENEDPAAFHNRRKKK
jgi:hypothetical protein